jgi:hypothetical protein
MGRRNSDGAGFLPRKKKKGLNAPPPDQPWVWFSFEMLESGSMRSLSVNGMRVFHRIQLEHMSHGGLENGRLKVTWLDFEKFGVSRRLIKKSIDETIAAGLVAIEQRGRRAHGEDRGEPTQYRLTYLPVAEPGDYRPATNDWKRFESNAGAARDAIKAVARRGGNSKAKADFKAWSIPP